MKNLSYKRHLAKTTTWRIVGTADTILLSWFITGNPFTGLKIGFSEIITKMVLYYFHERLWFNIVVKESRKRHLFKTISWRSIGTLDTMLLSWLITGSPIIGFKIGSLEIISKMLLYYLHERTWYKIDFGLSQRKTKNNE